MSWYRDIDTDHTAEHGTHSLGDGIARFFRLVKACMELAKASMKMVIFSMNYH